MWNEFFFFAKKKDNPFSNVNGLKQEWKTARLASQIDLVDRGIDQMLGHGCIGIIPHTTKWWRCAFHDLDVGAPAQLDLFSKGKGCIRHKSPPLIGRCSKRMIDAARRDAL